MSDAELTVEDRPASPIQIFCMKVVVVTAAVLVFFCLFFYFAELVVESSLRRHADSLRMLQDVQMLKGGPVFWANVENKLLKLADEPDIAPEKKQKILGALRKLSNKYKPYLDALNGDLPSGETTTSH
jgi:hypothetical protein